MLTAIYGAIYSAERLTRPVQDLIAGTRAVGKGDFGTRLPLPSRDEMGFLVHSFNDMTKRLRRAREETTRSQQAVERERERLSIILARLSTGVIAHRARSDAAQRQSGRQQYSRRRSRTAASASRWPRSPRTSPRYARFVGEVDAAARARAKKNGASRWTSSPKLPARACWCAPARRCRVTNTPRMTLSARAAT